MINNEILSFIKGQIAQGTTKDQVKDMLVTQGGWSEKDVEEAFETISFSGTSYPSVLKNAETLAVKSDEIEEKNKNLNSKDAFAPASELMKAVSSNAHPTIFSPGLSHVEQPKSMEPSISSSSFPAAIASSPQMSVEPMMAASENPRVDGTVAGNTESNALSGLRARIAMGVSAPGSAPEPASAFRPTIQPVIKESVVSPSLYPQPVVATSGNPPAPIISAVPTMGSGSSVFPRQSALSSLPSLNKAPTPSVTPSPRPSPQPLQPMAVFSKGQFGSVGTHMSPNPAQLVALQKQKGGRFLLGFMMFLIGLALGGISMNAYMNGYVKTAALNGIVEKGMDMIGLGTISVPKTSPPPAAPAEVPAAATAPVGGAQ